MFRRVTRTVAGLFSIFAAFALYAAAPSQNEPVLQEELPVFPTPGKVGFGKGVFMCTSAVRIETQGVKGPAFVSAIRDELKQFRTSATRKKGAIDLVLDSTVSIPREGYTLVVTPDQITVTASALPGLFYGKQSLLQLIRYNHGTIPACRIEDAPRMGWRGFMLDESRHFFGKQKVFQVLDRMAELKLNVFHWHLTDEPGWRIEIKRYPKLTPVGARGVWEDSTTAPQFYTQEEIREVIRYAADRNIMVVPEIDMPGHACAAGRAYPEISSGGKGRWKDFTFNPAKEETYQFLSNILTEVAALFPSPYIHIGGDEVHYGNQVWFTDPQIQAFIREKGLADEVELEHYFMRRMVDSIVSKGKTVIAWDEIVDAGISPDKAVVMWWRHDKPAQLRKALDGGYRILLTPRLPLYFDFVEHPKHVYGRHDAYTTLESVFRFTDTLAPMWKGREGQILGLQANMWTERIADERRLDYMTFPRLVAAAEVAWADPDQKDYNRFLKKLPVYLHDLDRLGIYYYDPFDPARRPEPWGPDQGATPPE